MNRAAVFGIGCVLAALPSIASGAIRLRGEDKQVVPGVPQTVTLDIFAEGIGDAENEQLFAYDIGFLLNRASGGTLGEVSFAPPYATKPDNFVFGDQPTDFLVAGSPAPTPTSFLLNVINNGTVLPDITTTPVKVARVVVNIPAGVLPGVYNVTYSSDLTAFGSGDPTRENPAINTALTDMATIEVVPEPASLGLLAVGGLLALRRRRIA